MRTANLAGGLEIEEFTLLFKSSREFFFAPVIEYGPLAEWKEIAGSGQEMQDVFWYIKEAIDAYFDGRPFQVTIKAGCIVGRKFDQRPQEVAQVVTSPFTRSVLDDEDEASIPLPPVDIASGSVQMSDPDDLDVAMDLDTVSADFSADLAVESELEAFIEGTPRPTHLDD